MKSLRKTTILCAATLTLASWAILQAQSSKPDTPAPAQDPQQTPPAAQQPPPTAQQPAPAGTPAPAPGQGPGKIVFSVNQVVVPVTVKDRDGGLVADLSKDEFRIFEDNVEQRISYFSNEAFPLSLVLLIDNDLKVKDAEEVAGSLRAVVAGLSASDEADICRFDQFFHAGKGFTANQDTLLTQLKRTELDTEPSVAPPSGPMNDGPVINGHSATSDGPNIAPGVNLLKGQTTKALDDAVYEAAQVLKDRGRDRRKMIVLISDGANGQRTNSHSYKETVKELLRYGVSVYSVAVSSAILERRLNRLEEYAHDTGGDVYYAAKRNSMEEMYSRITEEARNQYTLAYSPSGTNRSSEYHSIEVRVRRSGLTVDAREGYYSGAAPR